MRGPDDSPLRWLQRLLGAGGRGGRDRYKAAARPRTTRRDLGATPHRHPPYGGMQARRQSNYLPYVASIVVLVAALLAFLYLGLNWATGPGRIAGLANPPAPTPPPPSPAASPAPSPTVVEQTYVVKLGDTPAEIAEQYGITAEALLQANGIDDPRKLQVGQTLKIPPPPPGRR